MIEKTRSFLYVQIFSDGLNIYNYSDDINTDRFIETLKKYGLNVTVEHFNSPCG